MTLRPVLVIAALSALGFACGPGGPDHEALRTGRGVYADTCSACHGNRGQGRLGSQRWQDERGPTYGALERPIDQVMPGFEDDPSSGSCTRARPRAPVSSRVWLLFAAGLIINIAFVTGTDEQLAGPANLLMIAAGVMMLWRSRQLLTPDAIRASGVGKFPRFALAFLVGYLVLLTVLVSWIVRDVIDFEALTERQEGVLLAFDHTMLIGVMTNVLFGVLATRVATSQTRLANRVLWWGVNIGIVGFAIGLITVTAAIKQIFAPIMGVSLLVGLVLYLAALHRPAAATAS